MASLGKAFMLLAGRAVKAAGRPRAPTTAVRCDTRVTIRAPCADCTSSSRANARAGPGIPDAGLILIECRLLDEPGPRTAGASPAGRNPPQARGVQPGGHPPASGR